MLRNTHDSVGHEGAQFLGPCTVADGFTVPVLNSQGAQLIWEPGKMNECRQGVIGGHQADSQVPQRRHRQDDSVPQRIGWLKEQLQREAGD